MGFLHVYMGYTQPLFIQAIMTLKGVFECVVFFIARPPPPPPAAGDVTER